jgi:hypothetical protein
MKGYEGFMMVYFLMRYIRPIHPPESYSKLMSLTDSTVAHWIITQPSPPRFTGALRWTHFPGSGDIKYFFAITGCSLVNSISVKLRKETGGSRIARPKPNVILMTDTVRVKRRDEHAEEKAGVLTIVNRMC